MTLPDDLSDVPPAGKLVYKELQWNGPLTVSGLEAATSLSRDAIQRNLRRLADRDRVEKTYDRKDLRRTEYRAL